MLVDVSVPDFQVFFFNCLVVIQFFFQRKMLDTRYGPVGTQFLLLQGPDDNFFADSRDPNRVPQIPLKNLGDLNLVFRINPARAICE